MAKRNKRGKGKKTKAPGKIPPLEKLGPHLKDIDWESIDKEFQELLHEPKKEKNEA